MRVRCEMVFIQTLKHSNIYPHARSRIQTFKHSGIQTFKDSNIQTFPNSNIETFAVDLKRSGRDVKGN